MNTSAIVNSSLVPVSRVIPTSVTPKIWTASESAAASSPSGVM